jgi:iron complex outermembrane receptor protein
MSNPRGHTNRHFMLFAGTSLTALIAFGACAHAQEVEEVTVSGIKESIEHSIAMKRDSATVMDVITAEDIGKLPDQNIVDTLQRITGVQIDRGGRGAGQQSTLGEGTGFTIRGIGQNRVEFNGTNLTGAGDSGSVQLGDFNPEILAGLTVTKSPSAETVEGAIGGVVNLITKKPLDLDNFFRVRPHRGHLSRSGPEDRVSRVGDGFDEVFRRYLRCPGGRQPLRLQP